MRDSHNLAWKLDLVLAGLAGSEILETYQPEREPHVRFITEKAIELGRVQTLRDPEAARERDERLLALRRANREPEKLRYPNLAGGLLAEGDAGRDAGAFFLQRRVRSATGAGLFHDVVGSGPCVVARSRAVVAGLSPERLAQWREIGGRVVAITEAEPAGAEDGAGVVEIADVDGAYGSWLAERACDAVVVRPDWYVYGTTTPEVGLDELLAALLQGLGADLARDRVA